MSLTPDEQSYIDQMTAAVNEIKRSRRKSRILASLTGAVFGFGGSFTATQAMERGFGLVAILTILLTVIIGSGLVALWIREGGRGTRKAADMLTALVTLQASQQSP